MKTLYIDVYFLINFTVDLLSLYFGALFAKVKSSARRLTVASFISAAFACFVVLSDLEGVFYAIVLIANAVSVTCVFCGKISSLRKVKLFVACLIFETLIGGFVTFIYGFLDKRFYPIFNEGDIGAENKKLILLALMIMIAYGILRLLLIIFSSSSSEENAKLEICILGKEKCVEALVDSGNLLSDPMDSSPVIVVKRRAILDLIGTKNITEDERFKTKIRIIPAKTIVGERLFMGIKSDFIKLADRNLKFENTVIAIDEEEGTFGGYSALLPSYFLDKN